MSVMSTLAVSRADALLALAQIEFGSMSDAEIEARLDDVTRPSLYDVSIRTESRPGDAWNLGRLVGIEMGPAD